MSLFIYMDVKLTHPDRRLAALAARQHGVVSREQLLACGLGRGAIDARLRTGRLFAIHRGVYAVGHASLGPHGTWVAAVLAYGEEAVLSHGSAAALWGLIDPPTGPTDVTSPRGRPGLRDIHLHKGALHPAERRVRHRIPLTSVARTLFDLAELPGRRQLRRAFEEADRRGLLHVSALEEVCTRGRGRRGIGVIRHLLAEERTGATRSPLEDIFGDLCRKHRLPAPVVNSRLLGLEVDALWPEKRLIVEVDGYAYHGHRAAFERDRTRDAALQTAGYRVVRLTYRRLEQEPEAVAAQLRALLR